jgi:hypothetical protein
MRPRQTEFSGGRLRSDMPIARTLWIQPSTLPLPLVAVVDPPPGDLVTPGEPYITLGQ